MPSKLDALDNNKKLLFLHETFLLSSERKTFSTEYVGKGGWETEGEYASGNIKQNKIIM